MAVIMDDLEAAYQRGFQCRCEGRYAEARIELQRVLASDPTHINARHQLGLIQGFEGDFDGSLATLASLAKVAPRNTEVLYDLAMTQMMLGMYDEACQNFRAILQIDPGNEKATKQLAYFP